MNVKQLLDETIEGWNNQLNQAKANLETVTASVDSLNELVKEYEEGSKSSAEVLIEICKLGGVLPKDLEL